MVGSSKSNPVCTTFSFTSKESLHNLPIKSAYFYQLSDHATAPCRSNGIFSVIIVVVVVVVGYSVIIALELMAGKKIYLSFSSSLKMQFIQDQWMKILNTSGPVEQKRR